MAEEINQLNHNPTENKIRVMKVQKVYSNGFKALEDLSFGVRKNQIFCLLGPNGAGKSTAFDMITGRLTRTSGDIQLSGIDLANHSRSKKAFGQAGVCFQNDTLWDYMTVEQHLKVYAYLKGINGDDAREVIHFLLASLYMMNDAHKKVYTLSGGTKRKLCAAIALLAAPELIFLDEPSSGVDPLSRRRLWMLVRAIMKQTQGSTVLTTHYMQEAEMTADKIGKKNLSL